MISKILNCNPVSLEVERVAAICFLSGISLDQIALAPALLDETRSIVEGLESLPLMWGRELSFQVLNVEHWGEGR